MNIQNHILSETFFVTDTVVDWVDVFTRPVYKHRCRAILSRGKSDNYLLIQKSKSYNVLKL